MGKRMTTVPVPDPSGPVRIKTESIPDWAGVDMARYLFRELHKAYENPVIREKFERWKEEQRKEKQQKAASQ